MKKTLMLLCALCAACDDAEKVSPPDAAPTTDGGLLDVGLEPDVGPDANADMAPDGPPPDAESEPDMADMTADGAADVADLDAGDAAPDPDAGDAEPDAVTDTADPDQDVVDAGPDGPEPDAPPPPPNVDIMVDYSCQDEAYSPGECVAGEGVMQEAAGANHIRLPEVIEYANSPPATGAHRPSWGRWGEYEFLPPQRWLHNLEHGGVALLYHPCAPQATIDALRELARARPEDDTGAFRWVLTPYPDLPSTVAVVAWGWVYTAECVDEALIGDFIDRFYRMAPEDVRGDGGYNELWIGR